MGGQEFGQTSVPTGRVEWSGVEWSGVECIGSIYPPCLGLQGSKTTLFSHTIRPLMPLKPLVYIQLAGVFGGPARSGSVHPVFGPFGGIYRHTPAAPRPRPGRAPLKIHSNLAKWGVNPHLSSWNGFLRGARPGRGWGAAGGWRYIPKKGPKTGGTEPLLAGPPKTPVNK